MKKSNHDSSVIGDLLKKLHASYFGDKSDSDKPEKKSKTDADDAELLGQLKATLDKASVPEEKPSKRAKKEKKKSTAKHSAPPPIDEPIIEEIVEDEPVIEEIIEDEPVIEAIVEDESVIEEIIEDEPVIEEIVEDEPVIEEIVEEEKASTPQPKKKVIVKKIKKKVVATQEASVSKPEQPGVTVPRLSDAYDFSKEKHPEEEPIVIRPSVSKKSVPSETIVIRPRVSDYTPPRPTYSDASRTNAPIKIEAMQNQNEQSLKQDTRAPASTAKARPLAKSAAEKQNTSNPSTVARTVKRTQRAPVKAEENELLSEALNEAPAEELLNTAELESSKAASRVEPPPSEEKQGTPLTRRKRVKKQPAETESTLSELVRQRSGLSDDDIAMMFELGYDNELGKLVGYETMKKLRYEHQRRSSRSHQAHYRTAFGFRGKEYVGQQQNDSVLAAYAHDKRNIIYRLLLNVLISILLFFTDHPAAVGGGIAEAFESMPLLAPLLGMLLLLLCAILSHRTLYAGVRSILRFTPTPYSVGAVAIPLALIYDFIALFLDNSLLHVNFIASLILLLVTACDIFRVCNELRAFRIVSVNAEKTVLVPETPRRKKLRHGDKIVKIVNDDIGQELYRVQAADQTMGFFRRFNNMTAFARPITILIVTVTAAAFLLSFVTAILTASASEAMEAMLTVWLVGAPTALILNGFYPLYHTNRQLEQWNCTLVGEEAVNDFEKDLTVIFDDTDLYRIEKCSRNARRGENDLRQDVRLTEILFRKLGGTLAKLGGDPKLSDPPVSVVRIASNGVEAVVDSRNYILIGSAEFLHKSGISMPKESLDAATRALPNTSMMYVAIDGALKLSYELEYRNNTDFEDVITILSIDGNVSAIHSVDPNLTDNFLQNGRRGDEEPIRVMRPERAETVGIEEVADTGAVALGGKSTIVLPLHAAKMIKRVRRLAVRLQLLASLLGISLAALLIILGQTHLLTPLSITLYQALWLAANVLLTRALLSRVRLFL